jgi:hypothetical protein
MPSEQGPTGENVYVPVREKLEVLRKQVQRSSKMAQ